MIRKLKQKVVLLTAVSLLVLLVVLVAGMNIINYTAVVREADEALQQLSQHNDAYFGVFEEQGFDTLPGKQDKHDRLPQQGTPEMPYESPYFSVVLNQGGDTVAIHVSPIASVDAVTAAAYARRVTGIRVFFMNCDISAARSLTAMCALHFWTAAGNWQPAGHSCTAAFLLRWQDLLRYFR